MTPKPKTQYFVIRQESSNRGLFSLVSGVICNLDIADKLGSIPVVDFASYKTVYNEPGPINGTFNSWEYYFEPVSGASLSEVYGSGDFLLSDNDYPKGYDYTIANTPELFAIYEKYIRIKPHVEDHIGFLLKTFDQYKGNTLGVHFRGREMRTATGHWYQPTVNQMIAAISLMCNEERFTRIFVSSEDLSLIKSVERAFPEKDIFYNEDYFRVAQGNAYKICPRVNHFYRLGLEVLTDMFALSRCYSLVSCSSNVPWFSRFINNGRYSKHLFINNGPNHNRWPICLVSWRLKSMMPPAFFGFKTDSSVLQVETS